MSPPALALIVLVWLVLAPTREPHVSIRNPGRIGTAPADWWITIRVEPHPEHRLLLVEVVGRPGEYRRSDIRLEGARAAALRQLWFKALPAGCYWFMATVFDASQVLASATSGPVSIIGLDGNLCAE